MIHLDPKNHRKACQFHLNQLKDEISKRLDSNKPLLPAKQKNFIKEHIDEILTGLPSRLLEINDEFYNLMTNKKNKKKKGLNSKLKEIFNYGLFSQKRKKKYDAYDLAKNLDINTCTYCNRLYTVTVLKGNTLQGHITRPQFDHYFSKSEHPLLALSFYNLIPSCAICNSTLKGDKEFKMNTHIHPYVDNCSEHFKFSYTPQNTSSLKGGSKKLRIVIKTDSNANRKLAEKIQQTFDVFRIEDTYNGHTEEVRDLLLLKEVMSAKYLKILKTTYNLTISDDELYRLAFGTYREESEFHKRPFSKLKKDILKELGII